MRSKHASFVRLDATLGSVNMPRRGAPGGSLIGWEPGYNEGARVNEAPRGSAMVDYVPVLTTLLSIFFLSRIVPHYLAKRSPYLLWWSLGVLTFGAGTLTESINAIVGWSPWNTKVWYVVGALLGGYPLAQGTI